MHSADLSFKVIAVGLIMLSTIQQTDKSIIKEINLILLISFLLNSIPWTAVFVIVGSELGRHNGSTILFVGEKRAPWFFVAYIATSIYVTRISVASPGRCFLLVGILSSQLILFAVSFFNGSSTNRNILDAIYDTSVTLMGLISILNFIMIYKFMVINYHDHSGNDRG